MTPFTTLTAIAAIVAVSVGLFRGSFTKTVPVTVISDRAGLVMNPEAKVKLNGAQVGKVASIETQPDGKAALHLALDPAAMSAIPANVIADITTPVEKRASLGLGGRTVWKPE